MTFEHYLRTTYPKLNKELEDKLLRTKVEFCVNNYLYEVLKEFEGKTEYEILFDILTKNLSKP